MQLLNNHIWRQILEQQLQNVHKEFVKHIILINVPESVVQQFLQQINGDSIKTSSSYIGINIQIYQDINNTTLYVWQLDCTRESTIYQIIQYFQQQKGKYDLDVRVFCFIYLQTNRSYQQIKNTEESIQEQKPLMQNDFDSKQDLKVIKVLQFYAQLMKRFGELNITYSSEKFNKLTQDLPQFGLDNNKNCNFPPSLVIVNDYNKSSAIGLVVRKVVVDYKASLTFIKNNTIDGNHLVIFYLFSDTKPLGKDMHNDNAIISGQDHLEVIDSLIEDDQDAKHLAQIINSSQMQLDIDNDSTVQPQNNTKQQIQKLVEEFKNKLDQITIIKLTPSQEQQTKSDTQQIGTRFKRGNVFKK